MKIQTMLRRFTRRVISVMTRTLCGVGMLFVSTSVMAQQPVDRGCETYQAWQRQTHPRTDATGINNHAYPEANATYWSTPLEFPLGSVITIRGRYPQARYMALQIYDEEGNVLGALNDVSINPDPGQNNPFRSGIAQGTYTTKLVFGAPPSVPAPNTLYSGKVNGVALLYRVYHSNNPNDLPGGALHPTLPVIIAGGSVWKSCPPRPILPEESTLSGRLDNLDFTGAPPANKPRRPPSPPSWQFSVTNPYTPYFPNQDNGYLSAVIVRDFLQAPYNYEMVVIRFKTPTFTNTQAGVPPYAPANMRFWSMCQNEPITTSVVRCIPDNAAATRNGFATFVVSDPSKRPSESTLTEWGASWLPWGALQPGDVITDIDLQELDSSDGVFYYGLIMYRQTMSDPLFAQSIVNVSKLPNSQRPAAMGEYWPSIGYCTAAAFRSRGADCIEK